MQVEQRTLNTAAHPFQITAYWLDQISDFETAVDYPIMIICPGGGFTYHSGREEAPIATRMMAAGMHTVVLNYQLIVGDQSVGLRPRRPRTMLIVSGLFLPGFRLAATWLRLIMVLRPNQNCAHGIIWIIIKASMLPLF